MMSTMPQRNRLYNLLLHAYLDELRVRVTKPSDEEKRQRMREIWEQCYGDMPKTRRPIYE